MLSGVNAGGGEARTIKGCSSGTLLALVHVAGAVGVLRCAFERSVGRATLSALREHVGRWIEGDVLQVSVRRFTTPAAGKRHQQGRDHQGSDGACATRQSHQSKDRNLVFHSEPENNVHERQGTMKKSNIKE